ncbi:MAG: YdcF family protein [Nitrospinae bacterium]|nr:YdcF family protein [Nitrospinota bacterium]
MDTVFWIISKVFWLLASPNTSIFLILLAGVCLLFFGREKLGKKLIVTATTLILLISVLPVYQILVIPLENRFPIPEPLPEKVYGVIVLGGAEHPQLTQLRGQASLLDSAERLTTFVSIARRYSDAKLVYAGGQGAITGQEYKSAFTARLFFEQMGLDTSRVIFDSQSRNTQENAENALKLVQPEKGEKWVLITSAWHMPRSVGIFRKLNWQVIPYPVDFKTTGKLEMNIGVPRFSATVLVSDVVYEWIGLLYYWLMGRTSELFPGPL